MTQLIKRRMSWAGLPTARIGIHSLCHGFIATSLLVQQNAGKSSLSVMTDAAILAVWEALSATEFKYVKDETRRALPVVNFCGLTNTSTKGGEASFVPSEQTSVHLNSIDFHMCPESPPQHYIRSRS